MRRSVLVTVLASFVATEAKALPPKCEHVWLDLHGLKRVDPELIAELLPRRTPACFSDAEVAELERRLWSLAIFDSVEVKRAPKKIVVTVREKWTLIPGADFSAGRSLEDSYVGLNIVESNLFGKAQSAELWGSYAERNINGELYWYEHEQAARRFTFEGTAQYTGSYFQFQDVDWTRQRTLGRFGIRPPFWYGSPFKVTLLAAAYHEESEGAVPATVATSGNYMGVGSKITWDRYSWHDLTPRGFRLTTELMPGAFFSSKGMTHRASISMQGIGAVKITDTVGVVFRTVAEAGPPGDPNHAHLLGNIRGVRGLPDNLYRNTAHAFANVELRFASAIAPRWYLQGVAFGDAAGFARMNEVGDTQDIELAASAGLGMRVIPTGLAGLVVRLDLGELLLPEPSPFAAFGITQYF